MPKADPDPERADPFILGEAHPGDLGVIIKVRTGDDRHRDGLTAAEIELRLLEFGFVEGARVEVLHEGRSEATRSPCAWTVSGSPFAGPRR